MKMVVSLFKYHCNQFLLMCAINSKPSLFQIMARWTVDKTLSETLIASDIDADAAHSFSTKLLTIAYLFWFAKWVNRRWVINYTDSKTFIAW